MGQRAECCVLGVAVIAMGAIGSTAAANEGRAQALGYNLAFEDQVDVFLFPQLLPTYDGVYFHLPRSATDFYAGAIAGQEDARTFGIFLHRPIISNFDQLRPVATNAIAGGVGLLPGLADAYSGPRFAGQAFDLLYGDGQFGAAVRAHLWSPDSPSPSGALAGDRTTQNRAITVDATAGLRIDDSVNVRGSLLVDQQTDQGYGLRALLAARRLEGGNAMFRLVAAGELQVGIAVPEDGDSAHGVAIPLKGGLRIVPSSELSVGLLAGIDLQYFSEEVNPAREGSVSGVVLPAVELAAEWTPWQWLALRASVRGAHGLQLTGLGDRVDYPVDYEQLTFASGIGFWVSPFRLDAVVSYSMWQNGPYATGGLPGLFTGVTLAFEWDRPQPEVALRQEPGDARPAGFTQGPLRSETHTL